LLSLPRDELPNPLELRLDESLLRLNVLLLLPLRLEESLSRDPNEDELPKLPLRPEPGKPELPRLNGFVDEEDVVLTSSSSS
jgi:hypothetical protein